MGLESATYVNDLVTSNPLATDVKSQGDDHIRLIKSALKTTFPNASAPFYCPRGTSYQTNDVTITAVEDNKMWPINCEGQARSVTLPQSSAIWDGFTVRVVKADHSNYALTIGGYGGVETINGSTTLVLWQRYQVAVFQYFSAFSGWIANVTYIPPIGEVTAHSANSIPANSGWVLLNGTTIGDASSGASQRANADCRGLFYHLWAQYNNTTCPVSSGRGSTAQSDFDAHKVIGLPDMRGRVWAGLDDMGTSAAARLGNVITSATTNGSTGGAERLFLVASQLPNVQPTITISDPGHQHTNTGASYGGTSTSFSFNLGGSTGAPTSPVAISFGTAFTGITASCSSINGGVAQTQVGTMPPAMVGSWKIKL